MLCCCVTSPHGRGRAVLRGVVPAVRSPRIGPQVSRAVDLLGPPGGSKPHHVQFLVPVLPGSRSLPAASELSPSSSQLPPPSPSPENPGCAPHCEAADSSLNSTLVSALFAPGPARDIPTSCLPGGQGQPVCGSRANCNIRALLLRADELPTTVSGTRPGDRETQGQDPLPRAYIKTLCLSVPAPPPGLWGGGHGPSQGVHTGGCLCKARLWKPQASAKGYPGKPPSFAWVRAVLCPAVCCP